MSHPLQSFENSLIRAVQTVELFEARHDTRAKVAKAVLVVLFALGVVLALVYHQSSLFYTLAVTAVVMGSLYALCKCYGAQHEMRQEQIQAWGRLTVLNLKQEQRTAQETANSAKLVAAMNEEWDPTALLQQEIPLWDPETLLRILEKDLPEGEIPYLKNFFILA